MINLLKLLINGKKMKQLQYQYQFIETYVYKGIKNFFEISIGYIQKDDKYDSDDVKGLKVILNAEEDDETAEIILEFLVSNGVKNIGSEDFEKSYDENMKFNWDFIQQEMEQ